LRFPPIEGNAFFLGKARQKRELNRALTLREQEGKADPMAKGHSEQSKKRTHLKVELLHRRMFPYNGEVGQIEASQKQP